MSISIEFYSQWDSLAFWKPLNWRDFTVIYLSFETSNNKWIEITITLLGLGFIFHWFKECDAL
jgi:hypothetical protein